MPSTYKTPGVYIEEISKFPPSIAQVETAIAAFVGYTQKAEKNGTILYPEANKPPTPVRVSSLLEYEQYFGGAHIPGIIDVNLDSNNNVVSVNPTPQFYLYESLQLFFANGGGHCYIIAIGDYDSTPKTSDFTVGIDSLMKEDEPTLLLFPDAVILNDDDLAAVQNEALEQCNLLQDRFGIFDVKNESKYASPNTEVNIFRNKIGQSYLRYGAAYYPYLKTILPPNFSYSNIRLNEGIITLKDISSDEAPIEKLEDAITSLSGSDGNTIDGINKLKKDIHGGNDRTYTEWFDEAGITDGVNQMGHWVTVIKQMAIDILNLSTKGGEQVKSEDILNSIDSDHPKNSAPYFRSLFDRVLGIINNLCLSGENKVENLEQTLIETNPIYAQIVTAIRAEGVILPPSGAIAGVYARVDSERGVWQAPANVSLTAVKGPLVRVDNRDQEELNVDTNSGKSVNAIRSFTGKGTLVWGARTLAGNSNEWRYIPVRRFFNMAEESIKNGTLRFVFEPNDANTWIKVRAMIENFLTLQWRAGALAGAKPEQAFYVNVGLGETMTADDILNGRMIIEIGMAVVRPAEFIILKFSHKMQEA